MAGAGPGDHPLALALAPAPARAPRLECPIAAVAASALSIPTDAPESDGTLAWAHTTLVVVEVSAGAAGPVHHLEYFHDHARIERMLFDGASAPRGGVLRPDRTRPGLGVELKRRDAAEYAV